MGHIFLLLASRRPDLGIYFTKLLKHPMDLRTREHTTWVQINSSVLSPLSSEGSTA